MARRFLRTGGKLLLRAPKRDALDSESHGDRVVVVEFPDLVALRRWHDSPEYQALIVLRDQGADVVLSAYES